MDKAKDFEKGWEEYKAKSKQEIEEMIGIIQNAVGGCAEHWAKLIAEELHKNRYCKIHKGAVVFSREEYGKLKQVESEKDRLYEIKLDLEHQLIEKGWTDYEGADEIEEQARKETAIKFAEMVLIEYGAFDDKDKISLGELRRDINGILKGFTGGGKNDG